MYAALIVSSAYWSKDNCGLRVLSDYTSVKSQGVYITATGTHPLECIGSDESSASGRAHWQLLMHLLWPLIGVYKLPEVCKLCLLRSGGQAGNGGVYEWCDLGTCDRIKTSTEWRGWTLSKSKKGEVCPGERGREYRKRKINKIFKIFPEEQKIK